MEKFLRLVVVLCPLLLQVNAVGESCTVGGGECGAIPNTFCDGASGCQCNFAFKQHATESYCIGKGIGDTCANETECQFVPNTNCNGGQCSCNTGFSGTTSCQANTIGSPCSVPADCETHMPNSECDTTTSNQCICSTGFVPNNDNDGCTKLEIGSACTTAEVCNAVIANSECDTSSGTPGQCACVAGHAANEDGTSCEPIGLGGECSSQADCTVGNSECTGGPPTTCQCSQGYSESGSPPSSCTVNQIGSTCSADADCNGVIHNSQCDQSQCSCLPGYDVADGGTACTIKDCGDPASDEKFTGYTYTSPASTIYQSTFQVTGCATGYTGSASMTITCEDTGSWTDPGTSCTIVDCSSPPTLDNGVITASVTTYGATANYTCNTGYNLVGDSTRTCEAEGSWSGSDPTCDPVDCNDPTASLAVGYTLDATSPTTYETSLSYTCASGFTGDPGTIVCQADGYWSGLTGCARVDCGAPSQAGYTIDASAGTTFESVANVDSACLDGYTGEVTTTLTVTCGADGLWTQASGCEPVDCGSPSQEGYTLTASLGTTYTTEADVDPTCATGYTGTPDQSVVTCQASGTWTTATGCTVVDCGVPASDEKFTGYTYTSPASTIYQSTFQVTGCVTGYNGSASMTITCEETGSWTDPGTSCTIDDCLSPPTLDNGDITAPVTTYGATANYTCNTGYNLNGDATRTCEAGGSWSGSDPRCDPVDCGSPSQEGYTLTASLGTTYTMEANVDTTCATGYTGTPDQSVVTCQASGTWTTATGCTVVDCGSPSQEGYTLTASLGTTYTTEADVDTTCATGYTGTPDQSVVTCQASGTWTTATGCTVVDCGSPSQEGYTLTASLGTTYTMEANVDTTCATGYTGTPDQSAVTCQASGTWTTATGCTVVDCGSPSQEGYTLTASLGTTYTTEADVDTTCATGYTGTPDQSVVTCQASGTWTTATGCTVVDCGSPSQEGYTLTASLGTTYTMEANVDTTCATGYTGTPDQSVVTCQASGTWTTATGCTAVDCGSPSQEGYTLTASLGTTYTIEANVDTTCATGYTGTPDQSVVTCQASGTWTTATGCTVVDCGSPSQEGYTLTASLGTTYTMEANVDTTCATGYTGTPEQSVVTCQANGTWTTATGCTVVDCGSPSQEGYTLTASLGTTYTTEADVDTTCATGYTGTPDQSVVTCQASGTWTTATGCTVVDCGSPSQEGYTLTASLGTTYTMEANVDTTCATGYTGTPDQSVVTCQASGTWTTATGCTVVDCGSPSQEGYTLTASLGTTYTTEANVDPTCATGYTGTPDQSVVTCQASGTWTTATGCTVVVITIMTCEASGTWTTATGCTVVDCGDPASDEKFTGFTYTSPASTIYQSTFQVTGCAIGYDGSASMTITCEETGSWTDPGTSCTIDDCLSPPTLDNGNITAPVTTFGATANYTCNTGYNLYGDATRTCEAGGSWSGSDPTCDPVDCESPSQEGYTLTASLGTTYTMEANVDTSCATGYTGTPDQSVVTCQASGTWTTATGCTVVDCGSPSQEGYTLTASLGTTYTTEADVDTTCATGYTGTPDQSVVTCQASGTWTTATGCTVVDCGSPSQEGYTLTASLGTTYTKEANVDTTCATGYTGTPEQSVVTCQASGTWTTATGCMVVDCGSPSQEGYTLTANLGTTYTTEANVNPTCATGYTGTPDQSVVTCQASGTWTTATGCTVVDCGSPSQEGYTLTASLGTTYTMEANVDTCATGYTGTPDQSVVTCQASGTWTTATGCTVVDCGSPSQEGYTLTASLGTTYTMEANVDTTCATGYTGTPDQSVVACQASGTWTTATGCTVVDCGSPSQEGYTLTASLGTTYTMEANVDTTCATGYTGTPEQSVVTCQASGTWTTATGCTVVDCGSPSQDGYTITASLGTTYTIEANVDTTCATGYTGTPDQSVVTCQASGTWTTATGCTVVDCGSPSQDGYTLTASLGTTYTTEADVDTSCATGYTGTPDQSVVTCQASGTWTTATGCTVVDCGSPSQEGYTLTASLGTTYTTEANVDTTCATGYTGTPDQSVVTCQASGTWTTATGCTVVDCGSPSQEGYTLTASLGTTYTTEANVDTTCATGYTGTPDQSVVTCQASGTWTTGTGCTVVDCGTLDSPTDGSVSASVTTYKSVATYSCNTGYNLNGDETRTCLEGGAWNGTAPTCVIVDCGNLDAPTDGAVTVSNMNVYNSVATYSCNTGYMLIGATQRTCQADGSWSGSSPTCKIGDCGGLSPPADGSVTAEETTYGVVANYSCNTGYTLTGDASRTCQANITWSGTQPTCDIVDCEAPEAPTDGTVIAPTTTYESVANYSCNTGYNLTGDASRTCGADGAWNGSLPTCAIVDCGPPEQSGYSISASSGTTYLSEADVNSVCAEGYTGSATTTTVTCGENGSWSAAEGCTVVDCGQPDQAGYAFTTDAGTTYLSNATVASSCLEGYTGQVTTTIVTCGAAGSWSDAAGCAPVDCNTPDQAGYTFTVSSGTTYLQTATVATACKEGYTGQATTSVVTCTADAAWSEAEGCTPVDCGQPSQDGYTLTAGTTNTFGSEATVLTTCAQGYTGQPTTPKVTCGATGQWSSAEGCSPGDCGTPTASDGYTLGTIGETTYGQNVTYTCAPGYKGAESHIQCQADQTWSPFSGCVIVNCLAPSQPGYTFTFTTTTYLSEATVASQCKEGYLGEATTTTVTCGTNGLWSIAVGCTPIDCETPSPTEGYTLGSVDATTFGKKVNFTCATGYTGSAGSITCAALGSWSSPQGCERRDCGDPVATGYTLDTYTLTTYESTINVLGCDSGSGYAGTVTTPTITCLSTGDWSVLQGCALVDCGEPQQPTNGTVSVPDGTKYSAEATQSCNIGFEISGSQTIRCLASGSWSAGPVTCTRINCPTPIPPLYGSVSAPTKDYGSVATFSCDTGYTLVGDETKTCQLNGLWSGGDNPTCSIDGNCGNPPTITYTVVSLNAAGTIATYSCVDGYDLVNTNNQQLTCGANNQWTGARPQCRHRSNLSGLSVSLTLQTPTTTTWLNDPATVAYKRRIYELEITARFRLKTGRTDIVFIIFGFRIGSLIIDGEIVIPDSTPSTADYLRASSTLVFNEEPIVLDGEEASFNSITVANETFTKTDTVGYLCKAYELLEGPCQSGYECVATSTATNGTAECRSTAKEDNLAVIIGVGVGVPLFLILVVIIVIAAIYVRKQRYRREKYESESSSDDQSQFRQIATRYPGRYPPRSGIDGPGYYEVDGSAYSDSRRFNYPWDNLYHYNTPGRKMHIERPKY